MTKGEIASYLGMASVIVSNIDSSEEDDTMNKLAQALLEAQLILTHQAIEEYMKGSE